MHAGDGDPGAAAEVLEGHRVGGVSELHHDGVKGRLGVEVHAQELVGAVAGFLGAPEGRRFAVVHPERGAAVDVAEGGVDPGVFPGFGVEGEVLAAGGVGNVHRGSPRLELGHSRGGAAVAGEHGADL